MIDVNWCESICPDVTAFNLLLKARGKNIPAKKIKLIGSKPDCKYFVRVQQQLFPEIKFSLGNNNADVIFGDEGSVEFNITGVKSLEYNFTEFFKDVNLSGIQAVLSSNREWDLVEALRKDYDGTVMKLLMHHYGTGGSGTFREEDLDFLERTVVKKDAHEEKASEDAILEEEAPVKEEAPAKEEPVAEETDREESNNIESEEVISEDTMDEPVVTDEQAESPSPEERASKDEPAETKEIVRKDQLTAEEIESNRVLLESIRGEYERCADTIRNQGDSRWTVLENKIRDAVKKDRYVTQWCPLYLAESDDISTDLYRDLWDLDQKTAEFNRKVVHQVEHLGCPYCGNEWDEDITFLPKGIHYVECPECYAERGFEKC